jgi:Ribbon-helix-helix protein, copG family
VKKTSLYLDPDLDEALARRAADEGLTKAEFIRRTLAAAMQRPQRPKPQAVGIIKAGKAGISEDVDTFLAETGFGED